MLNTQYIYETVFKNTTLMQGRTQVFIGGGPAGAI